jgi:hypothetical protein
MKIDVGFVLPSGWVVSEPFDNYEHPAWWLKCPRCRSRVFATTPMVVENNIPTCTECAAYAVLQERRKRADDMIAAGRGNESAFEALVDADRAGRDAQMLRRIL